MIFDFFDSPELLDIQRTGFYRFLKNDIPQLLAKEFPIKVFNKGYSIELCLNENSVKLIAPEDNPRDCILKMKTYNCKLYAQVKIVCKRSSDLSDDSLFARTPPREILDSFFSAARSYPKFCSQNQVFLRKTLFSPFTITNKKFVRDGIEAHHLLKDNALHTSTKLTVAKACTGTRRFVQATYKTKSTYKRKENKNDFLDDVSINTYTSSKKFNGVIRPEQNHREKGNIVYESLPEWVLLGQIPMMTKRGHFIINGSPRVIVHQVVRSPGIYFQKLIKKDDQNRARFYGDIIPRKGVWVRLQMTKKGRVEVKFKKGKKVEVELLQKCLQVIENQTISKSRVSHFLKPSDKCSNPPLGCKKVWGFMQNYLRPKHRFMVRPRLVTPFLYSRTRNFLTATKKYQRKSKSWFEKNRFVSPHLTPSVKIKGVGLLESTRTSKISKSFDLLQTLPCYKGKTLFSKKSNTFEKKENSLSQNRDYYEKLFGKKKNRAESKTEHDAFIHTYDKLYRTTQDKELEEWQKKKKNQKFFKEAGHIKSNVETSSPSIPPLGGKNDFFQTIVGKETKKVFKACNQTLAVANEAERAKRLKVNGFVEPFSDVISSSSYPVPPSYSIPPSGSKKVVLGKKGVPKGESTHAGRKGPPLTFAEQNSFLYPTSVSPFAKREFLGIKSSEFSESSTKWEDLSIYDGVNTPKKEKMYRSLTEGVPNSYKNGATSNSPFGLQSGPVPSLVAFAEQKHVSTGLALYKQRKKIFNKTKRLFAIRKPENAFKRKKCSEALFSTFKNTSRYDLGSLGREKINTKFGCVSYKASLSNYSSKKSSFVSKNELLAKEDTTQLTALDLCSATLWLYRLRKGEESTDDIDHSQNRRVRTSGELLQFQFENGIYRLKNLLLTKLQEWRGDLHESTFSSFFKESYKPRYNPKFAFKKGSSTSVTSWKSSYKVSMPTIKELFSTKPITGALREFFGANPLSQYMDQTNPLAEITHKRRISSLGVGGVSRDSAGMAIRGIHPTHYGRICPIETPEGKNAGLVNSLAFYTKVDKNGFLKTPYYRVVKGQIQSSLGFSFCSAKEESAALLQIAPSDLQKSSSNILRTRFSTPEAVPVRVAEAFLDVFKKENPYNVQAIAISPIQMISVATSLIPFLEHNDANRALMGSNMQRQAVPLMISERPVVGTGLETTVIVESGHITESQISGFASNITASRIIVDRLSISPTTFENPLTFANKASYKYKFFAPNPFGETKICIASKTKFFLQSGSPTCSQKGYLCFCGAKAKALFEKSLVSKFCLRAQRAHQVFLRKTSENFLLRTPSGKQKFVRSASSLICTSGVNKFKVRNRALSLQEPSWSFALVSTRKGRASLSKKQESSFLQSKVSLLTTFSRSNQNTCITEKPLLREFDWVQKGDILTDCSASNNGELAVGKNVLLAYIPWEGYNFEDAIVISERLVREHVYTSLHIERYVFQAQDLKEGTEWFTKHLPGVKPFSIEHLDDSGLPKIGSFLKEGDIMVGKIRYLAKKPSSPYERLLCDILGEKNFAARNKSLYVPKGVEARVIYHKVISTFKNDLENKVRPPEAPKTVHIFLGEKRVIQVGDKISGRHGNKGVISTILPRQDMPYLPDGTPIDLILNPLGVPSRMNVGQVLECLLGLAASYLNQHFKIAAFDERYGVEASKSIVFLKLYRARLMSGQNWLFQVSFPGKTRLIDGRSGECFDQWITVGKAYILKLIHMVSEKIHARSTGPYALITQQPLRGRSNKGGQRLGEMEVWALEGFGAAYTLQELLTKKSDDFFGRKQIVDSILPNPASIIDTLKPSYRLDKGRAVLGHPEIFKVLLCELQALCLDLGVYIVTPESFQRTFLGVVH